MDLICFSHLRWNFVYQRPQHLLSRFTTRNRVFYIEEPVISNDHVNSLSISSISDNLWIIVPLLKSTLTEEQIILVQQDLLASLFQDYYITNYFFWYYTPMALPIGRHLNPKFIVYDCMDELSTFKFAPPALKDLERELLSKADIVFTGGYSLYNAKKDSHHNIYPFPSSIDKEHFIKARFPMEDPEDQASIPNPRFGFYGVIDERFDLQLLSEVSQRKPNWHFIILGPVVKIDEASLPRNANIHYLGSKTYNVLPTYLSGWDVALIPFVLDDSTKFISPTKTPEYLAAGKPVLSTAIMDVVDPYGVKGLVHIIKGTDDFIAAGDIELNSTDRKRWITDVDELLSNNSWDSTWLRMVELIDNAFFKKSRRLLTDKTKEVYV